MCKVIGCTEKKLQGLGFCKKHYLQNYRYGKIKERTMRSPNEINDTGTHIEVSLYYASGEKKGIMLIDYDDYEKIKGKKIFVGLCNKYASFMNNGKNISVHRLLKGFPKDKCIDHVNGNTLDNRKSNLRICTHAENLRNNRSLGITYDKWGNRWRAQININHKHFNLGSFKNKERALKVRRAAEIKYFGEFAPRRME